MSVPTERSIHFDLNGRQVSLHADEQRTLLWVLRTDFALTGTNGARLFRLPMTADRVRQAIAKANAV